VSATPIVPMPSTAFCTKRKIKSRDNAIVFFYPVLDSGRTSNVASRAQGV
jgi:hypothetical protein